MKVIRFIILLFIVSFILEALESFSMFWYVIVGVSFLGIILMYLASCIEPAEHKAIVEENRGDEYSDYEDDIHP